MVPVLENRSRSLERPVHSASQTRAQRLHAPAKSLPARRLDDEVSVIALKRVVHYPEAPPLAPSRDRPFERPYEPRAAKGGYVLPNAEGDVTRKAAMERLTTAMPQTRIWPGLPSRPRPPSSPPPKPEVESELLRATHVNRLGRCIYLSMVQVDFSPQASTIDRESDRGMPG